MKSSHLTYSLAFVIVASTAIPSIAGEDGVRPHPSGLFNKAEVETIYQLGKVDQKIDDAKQLRSVWEADPVARQALEKLGLAR